MNEIINLDNEVLTMSSREMLVVAEKDKISSLKPRSSQIC